MKLIKRIGQYNQTWYVSKRISDQIPRRSWERHLSNIPMTHIPTDDYTRDKKQKLMDKWIKSNKSEKIMEKY